MATTRPSPACAGRTEVSSLVAVERHACFETEGVARRESGGHDPTLGSGVEQGVPDHRGDLGVAVQLEAVLAGVPGAGDEDLAAVEQCVEHAVVAEFVERGLRLQPVGDDEGVERTRRGRPLDRDEGRPVGVVRHEDVVAGGALLHGPDGDVPVAGVRDDEEDVVTGAVDDEVVEDPAVRGQEQRVLRATDRHRAERPGERSVEVRHGLGPLHTDLGHVREVEDTRGLAHGVVFGEVGRVPDRHAVPGEVGERGTGGLVRGLERRRAQRF